MQTISATYRVTTPMFLGGAKQQAELRLPSFKGVLRFWWRALAWSAFEQNLSEIRKAEANLFGSADVGQSRLLMRWRVSVVQQPFRERLSPGLTYLAGMGLCRPNGELNREALAPGVRFTVEVALRKTLERNQSELLERAFIAIGLIGGLGARTRRGYGSLTLEQLEGLQDAWSRPTSLSEVGRQFQHLLKTSNAPLNLPEPPFTAFGPSTRIVLMQAQQKASADLLECLGNELLRHRSYGRATGSGSRENTLGEQAENRFPADHDTMRDYLASGHQPATAPERAVFGLPHNYFFGSLSQGRDLQVKADVIPASHDRRASPLFLHIVECEKGPPVAVAAFLPAQFLPEGERIRIADASRDNRRNGLRRRRQAPVEVGLASNQWQPIKSFLDRLLDPNQHKEPFATVTEVKHG